MRDQDSLPPTPKAHTDAVEDPLELVTVQDFFMSRRGSEGTIKSVLIDDVEPKKSSTAFKKIAGMFRWSSLGLGLKANTGLGESMKEDVLHDTNRWNRFGKRLVCRRTPRESPRGASHAPWRGLVPEG